MWKKCVALHKHGASSFQLGCVCHSVRGEVCAQSQALSSTLRQFSSAGCCSPALGRVQLCPRSKVGCSNFIFMIAKGIVSPLLHPDPFAQMDPEGDILNFPFPFKCHLDCFFPLPHCFTLAIFNYRKYYLSLRIGLLSSDTFQYFWFIPFSCIDLLGDFISYIWHKHCIILYCIIP